MAPPKDNQLVDSQRFNGHTILLIWENDTACFYLGHWSDKKCRLYHPLGDDQTKAEKEFGEFCSNARKVFA